jgi:hypothetical protein
MTEWEQIQSGEIWPDGGEVDAGTSTDTQAQAPAPERDGDDDEIECVCGDTFDRVAQRAGHQTHCDEYKATTDTNAHGEPIADPPSDTDDGTDTAAGPPDRDGSASDPDSGQDWADATDAREAVGALRGEVESQAARREQQREVLADRIDGLTERVERLEAAVEAGEGHTGHAELRAEVEGLRALAARGAERGNEYAAGQTDALTTVLSLLGDGDADADAGGDNGNDDQ